jgi:WD40 repeat protein
MKTGQRQPPSPGQRSAVVRLAFSPDGRRLTTWGEDGQTLHWQRDTGRAAEGKTTSEPAGRPLRKVGFGRGGSILEPGAGAFLTTVPGEVCLPDAATGKRLQRIVVLPLRGATTALLSPAGTLARAAAAPEDDVVELWDVRDSTLLARLPGHPGAVTALAFSTDERWLASGDEEGTGLVWDLDRLRLDFACRVLFPEFLPRRSLEQIAARLRQLANREVLAGRHLQLLDDDDFATRDRAYRALADMEHDAGPVLRDALRRKPSLEVWRRVERLLARLRPEHGGQPLDLARVRVAVRQLGFVSHPDARRLLEELARGDRQSTLTSEALQALARSQPQHDLRRRRDR